MISRRGFLKFLGLAAVIPKVAVEVISKIGPKTPLLNSEFGIWEGMRIITPENRAVKRWSEALLKESQRESFFDKFNGRDNPIIVSVKE